MGSMALVSLALIVALAAAAAATRPPSFLLFLVDDMGYGALGLEDQLGHQERPAQRDGR